MLFTIQSLLHLPYLLKRNHVCFLVHLAPFSPKVVNSSLGKLLLSAYALSSHGPKGLIFSIRILLWRTAALQSVKSSATLSQHLPTAIILPSFLKYHGSIKKKLNLTFVILLLTLRFFPLPLCHSLPYSPVKPF